MTDTRALVLEKYGRFVVRTIDVPAPGTEEVVVRVTATGICGSDLHGYTGENGRRHPGQVMGHETAGIVEVLGSGVTNLVIGQAVTINPVIVPPELAETYSGREQHCPDKQVLGVAAEISAAFADRVLVPARNIVPLPDRFPLLLGALIEPLAVAVHAVDRVGNIEGATVVVIGGGPIGQSLVIAAKAAGAKTIVLSEPDPGRRALCESLGALACDPAAQPVGEVVSAYLGNGASVVFDAVGISSTLRDAFAFSALGASICLVGMGSPTVSVDAYEISTQERSVIGTFTYNASNFAKAVSLAAANVETLTTLVSEEVAPADADNAFARLAAGEAVPGKILIRFDK